MNSLKPRGEPETLEGSMETLDFLMVKEAAGSAIQMAAAMYRSGLLRVLHCLVLLLAESIVFFYGSVSLLLWKSSVSLTCTSCHERVMQKV